MSQEDADKLLKDEQTLPSEKEMAPNTLQQMFMRPDVTVPEMQQAFGGASESINQPTVNPSEQDSTSGEAAPLTPVQSSLNTRTMTSESMPIDKPKPFSMDSFIQSQLDHGQNIVEEGQSQQRMKEALAAIMKASDKIGSSMAGANLTIVKPGDNAAADVFQKQADRAVTDIQEKDKFNAGSPQSQMARQTLKDLGVNVPENLSAGQIEKLFPNISMALNMKEQTRARLEAAHERNKDRQLQREMMSESRQSTLADKQERRNDKLEEKAKPSDKQISDITTLDNALEGIRSIKQQKPQFDTGPIAGRTNAVAGFLGMSDPKKTAFRAQVGEQLAQYIKSISGAAVSENERQALLQNLPTMNDSDSAFDAKLKVVEDRLNHHKNNYLNNLSLGGKNVDSFKEANKASMSGSSEIRRRDPTTGKTAVFDANKKFLRYE